MYRLLITGAIAGLAGGLIAHKKGRNPLLWAFLCFIFPFSVLVVLVLPGRAASGQADRCPYCSRPLRGKDAACPYCGKELPIDMIRCLNCGNFVPDKEYCMQCNKRLRA